MAGTAAEQEKPEEQEELSTFYLSCHHCSPSFCFCAHDGKCDNVYILAGAWQSLRKGYGHGLPEVLLNAFAV